MVTVVMQRKKKTSFLLIKKDIYIYYFSCGHKLITGCNYKPVNEERKEKKKCLFKLKTFYITMSSYIS